MEGWDGVVCGDADLALAIVSVLLANNLRELRLRQSIEASAKLLRDHNETLKDESAKLAESNRETQAIQEKILAARGASGSSLLTSQGELSALQKEYDEFVSTSKHTREKM